MGQRIAIISLTRNTTSQDAVDMVYEFAQSLRQTGWTRLIAISPAPLWVEREFRRASLLSYLLAGFNAGYVKGLKP